MAIEDYYNTVFNIKTKTTVKIDGTYETVLTLDPVDYMGAFFTEKTTRMVRVGKDDYLVLKKMYCDVSTPIQSGDQVLIGSETYQAVGPNDTNYIGHHYQVDLISVIE